MANKVFNLRLDLNGRAVFPRIEIRRNDYDTNVFQAQILQDGIPVNLQGYTPVFECRKPDGYYVRDSENTSIVDASSGKVKYLVRKEVFSAVGDVKTAYFVFEKLDSAGQSATDRLSTPDISFKVIGDAISGSTESGEYVSDLNTLVEGFNKLKQDYATLNPSNYALKSAAQMFKLTQDSGNAKVFTGDMNTLIVPGIYQIKGSVTNGYDASWGYLFVYIMESGVKQVFLNNGSPILVERSKIGANDWTAWSRYETTINSQAKADTAKTAAIDYAKSFGLGTQGKDVADVNNIVGSGFYRTIMGSSTNTPVNKSGVLIHAEYAGSALQIWSDLDGNQYMRNRHGEWGNWNGFAKIDDVNALKAITQNTKITNDDGSRILGIASDVENQLKSLGNGIKTIAIAGGTIANIGEFMHGTAFISSTGQTGTFLLRGVETANLYTNCMLNGTLGSWKKVTMGDSGWINIPLASGITSYAANTTPQYRRIGSMVYIRGVVTGITSTNKIIGTIPTDFTPLVVSHTYTQNLSIIANKANFARWNVGVNGNITLEGVSDPDNIGTWFPIVTSYLAD